MVTIIDAKKRTNKQNEEFISLILSGGLEMVKSESGNMYATVKKCSIPASFNYEVAKSMIGQQIEGTIEKVPCDEYTYTNPQGEELTVSHCYQYIAE